MLFTEWYDTLIKERNAPVVIRQEMRRSAYITYITLTFDDATSATFVLIKYVWKKTI